MPLLDAAQETTRELETTKRIIEDLNKQKVELRSVADAAKRELDVRNLLLTEKIDVNAALTEENLQLTRDLKRTPCNNIFADTNTSEHSVLNLQTLGAPLNFLGKHSGRHSAISIKITICLTQRYPGF